MKTVNMAAVLKACLSSLLIFNCAGDEVLLMRSTDTFDNWTMLQLDGDDNSDPQTQWTKNNVLKAFDVRNFAGNQNNWVVSPFISVDPLVTSVRVRMSFILYQCDYTIYTVDQCKQSFKLYSKVSTSGQTIDAAFVNSFTERGQVDLNDPGNPDSKDTTFNITAGSAGFYVALKDEGAHIQGVTIEVHYFKCIALQNGLISFPASFPSDTVVTGQCAPNSSPVGSLERVCYSTGQWSSGTGSCGCDPGFARNSSGNACYRLSPCDSAPCYNGGVCSNSADGSTFQCACSGIYSGPTCEIVQGSCTPDPCQNGGTCADLGGSYQCSCPSGYRGSECQNTDFCLNNPCQNGGSCFNNGDGTGYFCSCTGVYEGRNCENDASVTSTSTTTTRTTVIGTKTPPKQQSNNDLYIGLGVGAGVILLGLAGLGIYCYWNKKGNRRGNIENGPGYLHDEMEVKKLNEKEGESAPQNSEKPKA
ncbi:neurogenic locus notch homolog protein 1 isoform X2 [Lingula anatina]|uniref:Neurogenic locus notch homolog protein 1 isoform X2 n=1 Tax=Lingula anatina TaxID=7574 RepID=A0A1S3K5Q4_LINAN|nr:neurogenic locus notch homolog protein 1 isoform X2 [Lingula anatina]|eukprot:XP_013417960.1 neurogenic locus notch homolog protein 1 isoform X2 [Lingula anatina]